MFKQYVYKSNPYFPFRAVRLDTDALRTSALLRDIMPQMHKGLAVEYYVSSGQGVLGIRVSGWIGDNYASFPYSFSHALLPGYWLCLGIYNEPFIVSNAEFVMHYDEFVPYIGENI